MARRYVALQNDPDLAPFIMEGRPTGRQLGGGSYGSVEEIELVNCGDICAGKKIYEILLEAENEGRGNMVERFRQECRLMSSLHHPNITQFLGLCFLPNPVLLMEKLQGSLDELLENVPDIPLPMKRSFLEDVARGLRYLHTHNPQIIHRDLTAKNVLLTSSLQCKITDFGNSRIVNLQPGQLAQTLSRLPGTMLYMPPEAFVQPARYGPSLDIFSFGHLALFTLTQVFPDNLLAHNYPNPENNVLMGRTEVERRERYFTLLEGRGLGNQHPLVEMVRCCLDNQPSVRPTSGQLVTVLEGMRVNIDGPLGDVARISVMQQIASMRAIRERDAEIRAKNEEIEQLRQQMQSEVARLEESQRQKDRIIQEKNEIIREQNEQIQEKDELIQEKDDTIQENGETIQEKDDIIQEKDDIIQEKNDIIQEKDDIIQEKDDIIQENDETIQEKETQLEEMRSRFRRLQLQLQGERQRRLQQQREQTMQHEHQETIRMKNRTITTLREDLHRKEASFEKEKQTKDAMISRLQLEVRRLQVYMKRSVTTDGGGVRASARMPRDFTESDSEEDIPSARLRTRRL